MGLTLEYCALSEGGMARERNEDRCGVPPTDDGSVRERRGSLFIVADGMGAYSDADVAAEIAVRTIRAAYEERHWSGPVLGLRDALRAANREIVAQGRTRGHRMGAAVAAGV